MVNVADGRGAGKSFTTYTFRVVVEPDGDAWHADCLALKSFGAVTWGQSRAEALKHIREVVELVMAELVEDCIPLPEMSAYHPRRSSPSRYERNRLDPTALTHLPTDRRRSAA